MLLTRNCSTYFHLTKVIFFFFSILGLAKTLGVALVEASGPMKGCVSQNELQISLTDKKSKNNNAKFMDSVTNENGLFSFHDIGPSVYRHSEGWGFVRCKITC